jgi:hypothetical protein
MCEINQGKLEVFRNDNVVKFKVEMAKTTLFSKFHEPLDNLPEEI